VGSHCNYWVVGNKVWVQQDRPNRSLRFVTLA
jgi:hypothetical protein